MGLPEIKIQAKRDREINLSIASSRHETSWKNKSMSWSQFLDRLRQPTQTQETIEEYLNMTRTKQGEIKDVGGFVGGFLKQGKRSIGNVQNRSIVTLDADYLKGGHDYWDDFQLLWDHAIAIYSTHKHQPSAPRVRVVIPLKRPVTADEYVPLARKIAETFGMDLFDDTTYQAERLMYWPSHARNGEYVFDYVDAPWVDPDVILAEYPDWRDSSYWPESSRGTKTRERQAKKQGDPLEKPGIIGAFCRTYDIQSAIANFLPDVYEPTHHEDRYTYAGGSTAGGLVLYDDKFAYSHHSTDPVGDTLTNAFDLVRIHLFGDQDADAKPETPVNRLPSYKEMQTLALSDKTVATEYKLAAIDADFADEFEDGEAGDGVSWVANLRTVGNSTEFMSDIFNVSLILANDPDFKGKLGYNLFNRRIEKTGRFPWDDEESSDWSDEDIAQLRGRLSHKYKMMVGQQTIYDAVLIESQLHGFHPVKDFIKSETWDEVPRIDKIFIDYLGAEDSPYTRAVSRLFFGAAVARIFKPGCKFDYVIVLEGSQGIGKSTLLQKLATSKYFTDSLEGMGKNKDDYMVLSEAWIIELGELAAMRRTEIEQTKRFISATSDKFRPPYGRTVIDMPRHVVFAGTTNDSFYLKDSTGNRRWLPIPCEADNATKNIFDGSIEKVLHQLWAEAYYYFENDFKFGNWLDLKDDIKAMAQLKQQDAESEDLVRDKIIDYLELEVPVNWYDLSLNDRRDYIDAELHGEELISTIDTDITMQRDVITTKEVLEELFNKNNRELLDLRGNSEARKVGLVLSNLAAWKKQTVRLPGENRPVKGFKRR